MATWETPRLKPHAAGGGRVEPLAGGGWRLSLPAGPASTYRLAQLDDYLSLPRNRFPARAPFSLSLQARLSAGDIPGTWGFGLWNDPFTATTGREGAAWRLPCLPNAAWYFFASPPNYLSLRDDLPAQGFLAATFRAPLLPAPLLAPGIAVLPLFMLRPAARTLRRLISRIVPQSTTRLSLDPTTWHAYSLEWLPGLVRFRVDGDLISSAPASPRGPLGLVLWIDNQYAAFTPEGRVRFGSLACEREVWIELKDIQAAGGG